MRPSPWLRLFLLLVVFGFFLSCGEEQADPSTADSHIIQIINYAFIPSELEARAGDTIFFQNFDDTPHLILSESAPDLFDDTGTFASTFIDIDEVGMITIPAGTAAGTQLLFYSDVLKQTMATPNGSITIVN